MINDIENIRKKILFRSWHRGTKEMDLILGEFANNNVSDMDLEDLNKFQEFLNLSDPDPVSYTHLTLPTICSV